MGLDRVVGQGVNYPLYDTARSNGFGGVPSNYPGHERVGDSGPPQRPCIASPARAGTLRGRSEKPVSQAQGKGAGDTGVYVVDQKKASPPLAYKFGFGRRVVMLFMRAYLLREKITAYGNTVPVVLFFVN